MLGQIAPRRARRRPPAAIALAVALAGLLAAGPALAEGTRTAAWAPVRASTPALGTRLALADWARAPAVRPPARPLTLALLRAPPATIPGGPMSAPPPAAEQEEDVTKKWWFWAAIGAVVVTTVVLFVVASGGGSDEPKTQLGNMEVWK